MEQDETDKRQRKRKTVVSRERGADGKWYERGVDSWELEEHEQDDKGGWQAEDIGSFVAIGGLEAASWTKTLASSESTLSTCARGATQMKIVSATM